MLCFLYASIDSIIFVTHFTGHSVNRSAVSTLCAFAARSYMHAEHFDSNQDWGLRELRTDFSIGLEIAHMIRTTYAFDFYWIFIEFRCSTYK